MNKISIIIPVYNVEKYLSTCLDSVINQTYQNLEIILVNDGSTDACPKICEEYATKDNRIKVIHKKNGGLSDARNAGLKIATGQYISFVDSDDLLSLDFYQSLLLSLIENDADIAECDFFKFEKDEDLDVIKISNNQVPEIFETEIALELLMKEYLKQMVWNKIYKKELVEVIEFPINRINEDEFWTYKIFGNAKKIVKIQDELYFYRQQGGSIMGSDYSIKRLDGLQALEDRIFYMKEHFPNLENLSIKFFCFGCTYHYQQLCLNQNIDSNKIIRNKIFLKVKKYNKLSIYKNWHWKDIVWYKLFIWSPKIYMKLRDYMEEKVQKRLTNKTND